MQITKQIKIGNETFEVKYPNVGEKLSIENVKMLLTDGNYGDLARSGHNTAKEMLDLVDAVAYFTILIPEIKTSLKLADFLNMEPKKSRMYVKAYRNIFMSWFEAIEEELAKEDEDEQEVEQV